MNSPMLKKYEFPTFDKFENLPLYGKAFTTNIDYLFVVVTKK